MQLMVLAQRTGEIAVNLPERIDYQPGQVLEGVKLTIKNTTDRDMTFDVLVSLLDPERIALIDRYLWDVNFDTAPYLTLKARESKEVPVQPLSFPITNCVLSFDLIDVATLSIVDSYRVLLVGPAAPPIWETLIPLLGLAVIGMVFARLWKS